LAIGEQQPIGNVTHHRCSFLLADECPIRNIPASRFGCMECVAANTVALFERCFTGGK